MSKIKASIRSDKNLNSPKKISLVEFSIKEKIIKRDNKNPYSWNCIFQALNLIEKASSSIIWATMEKVEKNQELLKKLLLKYDSKSKSLNHIMENIFTDLIINHSGWKSYKRYWWDFFLIRIQNGLINGINSELKEKLK